ncbi:unnamed protein product [Citrullus colocynthis]|uniref:Uncharacterized protein n=1 Tax=Citrullus colocynthis TaxID=252529 RepID=A0ABP0XNM9_9ROSI
MKMKKVEKEPGGSLIEVDDEVHKFIVGGGRLHPKAQEIYIGFSRVASSLPSAFTSVFKVATPELFLVPSPPPARSPLFFVASTPLLPFIRRRPTSTRIRLQPPSPQNFYFVATADNRR